MVAWEWGNGDAGTEAMVGLWRCWDRDYGGVMAMLGQRLWWFGNGDVWTEASMIWKCSCAEGDCSAIPVMGGGGALTGTLPWQPVPGSPRAVRAADHLPPPAIPCIVTSLHMLIAIPILLVGVSSLSCCVWLEQCGQFRS